MKENFEEASEEQNKTGRERVGGRKEGKRKHHIFSVAEYSIAVDSTRNVQSIIP